MLDVKQLSGGYDGVIGLRAVDLTIEKGELVAVIGRNGAGKTTLLKTISGLLPALGGAIEFNGRNVTSEPAKKRVQEGIVLVPEGRQIFDTMTVDDNLRLGAFHRSRIETEEDLAKQYELFPALRDRRFTLAGALSGGQQQMVAMGRGLMASPKLLLLDEPSMGLAPQLVAQIFKIITDQKNAGNTILLVEQNARAALAIADRAYVLESGKVTLSGKAKDVANDPEIRKAYLGR